MLKATQNKQENDEVACFELGCQANIIPFNMT